MEPAARHSLWTASTGPDFKPLDAGVRADVAIIGGGIVGITAAHLLREAGRSVVLVEARRIGRQVTGLSTAKVTSQHNLIYARLARTFGHETAQVYADANEAGLARIATNVVTLGIDCGFERLTAYTYTSDPDDLERFEHEAEVAAGLGLPALFTHHVPLPFDVPGAVAFDYQAQFDPYAYLRGLAERIAPDVRIAEQTRVLNVDDGEPCRVDTDRGAVMADDVIVATNIPILDRGLYFARAFPIGHAVIAARIEGDPPDGMFISTDTPSRSIRGARDEQGSWIIVAGERYRPGKVDTEESFRVLEEYTRERFPVREVVHRWTNEDYQSSDGLPYIGRLLPTSKHVYIATGFSGWGITTGTMAAQILADAITETANPWAKTFDSNRVTPVASARRFLAENAKVAGELIGGRLARADEAEPEALAPGEGVIVEVDGEKAAVSRRDDGVLCAVSALCSHLGCVVKWNHGMQTWDCPCHGSIFAPDGTVLHGPATKDLAPVSLERAEPTATAGG